MTSLSQLLAEEVAAFEEKFPGLFKKHSTYDVGVFESPEVTEEVKAFLKAHDARVLSALIQELEKHKGATIEPPEEQAILRAFNGGIDKAIHLIKSAMKI